MGQTRGSIGAPAAGRGAISSRTPTDVSCEVVCANGSIVLDHDGRTIHHDAIDPAALEELLAAFPEAPFECVGLEHSLVRGSREAHAAGFRAGSLGDRVWRSVRMRAMRRGQEEHPGERLFDQSDADVLSHEVCKVNCHLADEGMVRELRAFLAERTDTIVNAPFSPSMFEITATGVDKGAAVAWLAGHLGVALDEVAVYGDGGNDVAMLGRFAPYGHAYATYGACDEARRAAGQALGSNVVYAVPRHVSATVRAQGRVG